VNWTRLIGVAPILFCKACESASSRLHHSLPLTQNARAVFIAEVTARAFLNADACKRRTVNKSDVARALARSDMFDFLIDIVPREDVGPPGTKRKSVAEHTVYLPSIRPLSAR
jgi:nuclear transcription factor Y, gamma